MIPRNCLNWLLFAPLVLVGCSWTNTIWLVPPDKKTSDSIQLISPTEKPKEPPFALVEAKAIKTWDSQGDLLGSNIKGAKEIGATKIWCPASAAEQASFFALPIPPAKEEIGLLKEFVIAVTDLIKAVIALPVTFRSEAISKTTLLCAVYR